MPATLNDLVLVFPDHHTGEWPQQVSCGKVKGKPCCERTGIPLKTSLFFFFLQIYLPTSSTQIQHALRHYWLLTCIPPHMAHPQHTWMFSVRQQSSGQPIFSPSPTTAPISPLTPTKHLFTMQVSEHNFFVVHQ